MKNRLRLLLAAYPLLGLLLLTASLSAAAEADKSEIRLGMSTVLSGPAAELGREMQRGVLAGLEQVNQKGGFSGRQLRLISYDDGYEPSRTAPNMHRLLDQDHVLAVIGNVGTPTAIASLPLIRAHQTLFFAPFSGAGGLRRIPPERYVINVRASYAEEISAMVDGLLEQTDLRLEEIAFFTQRDGYGDAGYVGGFAALKRHGLQDDARVLHVRYRRNTLAVENALADLLLAEPAPRAVIMVGAYAPCAKFIRLARQSGLDSLLLNVSFVGSAALAHELGDAGDGVVITQVVPHPQDLSLPLVRDYQEALKRHDQKPPSFISLEGYLALRTLLAGMEKAPAELDRENLIEGLERLGDFDLGLGTPLQLNAAQHQASHHVWPTLLEKGQVVSSSWAEIRQLLPVRRSP
jgi:ABC-type branched-subunit amino acid transport system substrate-binding protein